MGIDDPRVDEARHAARAMGTMAELRASSSWRIARGARLRAEAEALEIEALVFAEEAGRRRFYGVVTSGGEGARGGASEARANAPAEAAAGAHAPGLARASSSSRETESDAMGERAGLAPGKAVNR